MKLGTKGFLMKMPVMVSDYINFTALAFICVDYKFNRIFKF